MVAKEDVKLYGMWASPAVRRVEWALRLKGVEYEYIEEDLSNKSPSLLKYNPINKEVPVLVHDGRPVVESCVILEYIDETWDDLGRSILPKDPYERAAARFWATFTEGKCREVTKDVFWTVEGTEERGKAVARLEEVLQKVDEGLEGKAFFGGDAVGYADLVAGWMAFWLGVSEEVAGFKVVDSGRFPSLASWIDNFLQVPAIKESLPPRDKTLEFFHNFRKLRLAAPQQGDH